MKPIICVALFALMRGGCANSETDGALRCYVLDRSASAQADRKKQMGTVLADLESLPDGTPFVIFRMASRTEEILTGVSGVTSNDAVSMSLIRDAKDSDSVKGTDFSKMAEALKRFCARSSAKKIRLRILTDGADDYAGDNKRRKAYKAAAAVIAKDKRVSSIIFQGVKPPFREAIRTAFGAAGDRLQIETYESLGEG